MNQSDSISTRKQSCGKLFVVATPIGNMEDITLRALRVLGDVHLIAAEDTRHTGKFLKHHKIVSRLVSCHEHNEAQRSEELIEKMKAGHDIALVSNAGTPAVSDPGYRLIQKSIAENIEIVPVPGVSSVIAALCVSGLPSDAFVFIGFVSKKQGKRRKLLKDLEKESRTLIFFESPHRLLNLVEDLLLIMGERRAVLAREITKLHEEFIRGNLSQLKSQLKLKGKIKGECTLLVEGNPSQREIVSEHEIQKAIMDVMDESGEKLSGAVKIIADQLSISKKKVYEQALKLKK